MIVCMKKRVGADNRGFTLLEVILSIAILGIITVPIMKYFTDSMRYTSLMEQKQKATLEAQDTIEFLKAQDRVLVRRTNPSSGVVYYWTPDAVAGADETDTTTGTFQAADISAFDKTDGKGVLKLKKSDTSFDTLVTISTNVSANSVSRPIIYGIDDTKNIMIIEREEEQEAILYFMALNTAFVANQNGMTPFASPSASPTTTPTPAPGASASPGPVVVLTRNEVRKLLQREINIEIDKDAEGCYTVKAYYEYSCTKITDQPVEKYQTSNLIDTRIEKLEGLYLLFNMTDDTKDKINVNWKCLAPAATEKAMELVLVCQNLDQLAGGAGTPAPAPTTTPTPTAIPSPDPSAAPTSEPFAFTSDKYKPTLVLQGQFSAWLSKLTVRTNLCEEIATESKGEITEITNKTEIKPLTSTGTPVRIVALDVEVYKAGELATGGTPLVKMQTTKGE